MPMGLFHAALACWLASAIVWAVVFHRSRPAVEVEPSSSDSGAAPETQGFAPEGKPSPLGGAGLWLAAFLEAIGLAAWTALLAVRVREGAEVNPWPFATPDEFLSAMVWAVVGVHLVAELASGRRGVAYPGLLIALVLALVSRAALVANPLPLPPAFRSLWFYVHTVAAVLAYGAFAVACGAALPSLLGSSVGRVPAVSTGAVKFGYTALTFSMLSGAVWSQLAWGAYWAWSPKEVWTFVSWLLYTLFLHLRPLPRWRGRLSSALLVLAFGVVLFTLFGTGWLARRTSLETLYVF